MTSDPNPTTPALPERGWPTIIKNVEEAPGAWFWAKRIDRRRFKREVRKLLKKERKP